MRTKPKYLLKIRRLTQSDREKLKEILNSDDADRYLSDSYKNMSSDEGIDAMISLASRPSMAREFGILRMIDATIEKVSTLTGKTETTEDTIGFCTFTYDKRFTNTLDIFYIINKEYRSLGLGTLSLKTILEYIENTLFSTQPGPTEVDEFQGLEKDDIEVSRIQLVIHSENKASIRAASKAGFELEGTARNSVRIRGDYGDCVTYAYIPDHIIIPEYNTTKTVSKAQQPVTQQPATPAPVVQQSAAPTPVVQQPVMVPAPVVQQPATVPPVVQQPAAMTPVVQQPAVPVPAVQQSATVPAPAQSTVPTLVAQTQVQQTVQPTPTASAQQPKSILNQVPQMSRSSVNLRKENLNNALGLLEDTSDDKTTKIIRETEEGIAVFNQMRKRKAEYDSNKEENDDSILSGMLDDVLKSVEIEVKKEENLGKGINQPEYLNKSFSLQEQENRVLEEKDVEIKRKEIIPVDYAESILEEAEKEPEPQPEATEEDVKEVQQEHTKKKVKLNLPPNNLRKGIPDSVLNDLKKLVT